MRPVLATSVCVAHDGASLLARWQALAAERVDALALDARLPLEGCRAVLQALRGSRIACVEIPYRPRASGPSPLSADRHERRAAQEELLQTLVVAAEHGVARVVLHPASLPLPTGTDLLRERFARGSSLDLEALLEERAVVARAACDHLCMVLDGVLRAAESAGTTLAFLTPSPWPQQSPNASEVERLRAVFGGGRHGVVFATDRAHVARLLDSHDSGDIGEACAVRLADACGLRGQLPLDSGEADWRAGLAQVRAPSADLVVTISPAARPAEVEHSLELCAEACAG